MKMGEEVLEPAAKKFKYCWGESSKNFMGPNITELPPEVLLNMFRHLDFESILNCAMMCKKFNNLANDQELYKTVYLKYNMDTNLMTSYINRISYPKQITIEYKMFEPDMPPENYSEFDEYVTWLMRKCSQHVVEVSLINCRNENVLVLLCECRILTDVRCIRCKGNFDALPTLKNLRNLTLLYTEIPNKILNETLQDNPNLQKLSLSGNARVNINDVCYTLSRHNYSIEELYVYDKKRMQAKGIKALARLSKLRILKLIGGPFYCDPEDSLELLAAGCPLLERLSINGWRDVNDKILIPVLRSCTQLRELGLRGIDITIKSCREAALSLPFLQTIDVCKCSNITKSQIAKMQRDFQNIQICF